MKIYKYSVAADDLEHKLELTLGRVVAVGDGGMMPFGVCFWLEFDPELQQETRTFRIFGTGHTIPSGWAHRGTVDRFADAGVVWHLYEWEPF